MENEIQNFKILLISYRFYPYVGGIEVNSEILANYFCSFGAQVKILTTTKYPSVDTFKFEVFRNPNTLTKMRLFKWADVVFENNPSLNLSFPQIIFRKPHVVALRTWVSRMSGEKKIQDKIKLKWIDKATKVIAVSDEVRKRTYRDAIVIGNPYRSEMFKDLGKSKKGFAFLGRLVSDKGADMCIEIINALIKHERFKENSTLTIIGDGPERENLKLLVKDLGLTESVGFTGVLRENDLVDKLNEHKYLLVPSRWREPFGNIALEGMACGCLPIVSDGGGLVDAVGEAGVVFQRNNLEDMTKKIMYLLENDNLETSIRSNFKKHLEKHRPENVSRRYFEVLKRACNEKR